MFLTEFNHLCVSHVIYYKQVKARIDVLRVLHQSMDVQKHF